MWEKFYEDLFGGFENLADTAKEDEEEEDELENIPAILKNRLPSHPAYIFRT